MFPMFYVVQNRSLLDSVARPCSAADLIGLMHSYGVNYVVCRGKIYILKQAIQLVLPRYYILRISYDELVSPDRRNIHNANCPA